MGKKGLMRQGKEIKLQAVPNYLNQIKDTENNAIIRKGLLVNPSHHGVHINISLHI